MVCLLFVFNFLSDLELKHIKGSISSNHDQEINFQTYINVESKKFIHYFKSLKQIQDKANRKGC